MTDREILEKYINLNNSCLDKEEKIKVMDTLYKYKEAFSFRDEIGTCPNIEVEIDVTDKSPFFIRPYHVREEDKAFIDKEMKQLCYMGILKEGFLAYSSPVMLIRIASKCEDSKEQFSLSIGQGYIFNVRKFQMQGIVSVRSKGCLSLAKTVRKQKKILWHTPIFQ